MEKIPILSAPAVDEALRRYVTANALFEATCVAMLERDGVEPAANQILAMADREFCESGQALEAALQLVLRARFEEACRLAGLLGTETFTRSLVG